MVQRLIPSGVLAAIAGAAMAVAGLSSPSPAFTLSSPSTAEPVIKADVQQVWYRHDYHHHYYHHHYYYVYDHYYGYDHTHYYGDYHPCYYGYDLLSLLQND